MTMKQRLSVIAASFFTIVGSFFTFVTAKAVVGSPEIPDELKQKRA